MSERPPLMPGACLGMLGGGQLGRMFCLVAHRMGYEVRVLDPDSRSPAGRIASRHIAAPYNDTDALEALARDCDAVTTEFENVPSAALATLQRGTRVYPGPDAVAAAQNRNVEKDFANRAGLTPVAWYAVREEADLAEALAVTDLPAILKTASLGYDGKGQRVVDSEAAARAAFRDFGSAECVLERRIDLAAEISVVISRNATGDRAVYPVAQNEHRNGILHMTSVPARVSEALQQQAREQAGALVEALDYVGVLAIEFFIDHQERLYFNEMAPRPHNSGHFTLDACVTCQFEQQLRAVCGLRPGSTNLLSPVAMVNLLGDIRDPDWRILLDEPDVKLHLYGKDEPRPGRKMGHFNVLASSVEQAMEKANALFEKLAASR